MRGRVCLIAINIFFCCRRTHPNVVRLLDRLKLAGGVGAGSYIYSSTHPLCGHIRSTHSRALTSRILIHAHVTKGAKKAQIKFRMQRNTLMSSVEVVVGSTAVGQVNEHNLIRSAHFRSAPSPSKWVNHIQIRVQYESHSFFFSFY